MPISAITASGRNHGFGFRPERSAVHIAGNPVSCAAANKVMDIMKAEDFAGKARHIADRVMAKFNEFKDKYPVVGDVRGLGAMIGVEYVKDKESRNLMASSYPR